MVAWMNERTITPGDYFHLKHTTRWVRAVVRDVHYGWTSTRSTATSRPTASGLNEVGRVTFRVTQPLFYDSYRRNRTTGSFILADEATNVTVGAGMLLGPD